MIVIGAVASAHGLRGQFKVKPFTTVPEAIASYGPVRLQDGRTLHLKIKSVTKNLVLCEADEITTRTAAESLKCLSFSVDRSVLPDLDEGEHYHADLLGMKVETPQGQDLGQVTGIHDFGAGEIIEVAGPDGGQTQMYPFHAPFLQDIDIPGGKIILAVSIDSPDAANNKDQNSD